MLQRYISDQLVDQTTKTALHKRPGTYREIKGSDDYKYWKKNVHLACNKLLIDPVFSPKINKQMLLKFIVDQTKMFLVKEVKKRYGRPTDQ